MMRPGTDTGSLVNHLYSRMTQGQPIAEVGMGATVLSWSDRHAATITAVRKVRGSPIVLTVVRDRATVVSGSAHDGSAEYAYERDPDGHPTFFRQRKDGSWQQVRFNRDTNRWVKTDGSGLRIGSREEYRDPSF